ncbi:restriction endonuclease subunit S [Acinetobacter towneri]|uniref:restriction endonuclease subunit S n=1 Tax=Acinetobacter towneri TaxID=202956 RepID=UPI002935544C|nr:restriction endonuclease subunit S [Acinetobacter towneri]MDV2485534.1 restriction endonuclease subunit S [Acinetobacter towneri]
MSEWQTYNLKDVTTKIGSGSTPTGGSGAYKAEGISLIRSQNVLDYKFTDDGLAFIDDDQAYALRNVIVEPNDVLLNITGDSVARCCGAPIDWLPARVNQHVAILRSNPAVMHNKFLKYALLASKEELLILSEIGGTRNALTKGMLEDFEIQLPPLPEQKAIASVLSSLDDKIDLLHRQNKILEAMAETLFRQWFIEDAKEDWEECELSDFGQIVCGKTPSKSNANYFGNDIPFLKIPDMHGKVFIAKTTDNLSQLGALSQAKKMVPKNSICVSCIATVGLVSITDCDLQTNQQINSIIPNESKFLYYLYEVMLDMYEDLHNLASGGTATLNLNTGDFSKIKIAKPDDVTLLQFNNAATPLFSKIRFNDSQIQTLEQLRDTLLPKLMSGEVRVQYQTEEIA